MACKANCRANTTPTASLSGNNLYHTENGTPELVAEITGNGDILYIHTDHLGTPRLATDHNQTVVWRWDSNAFGHSPVNDDPDGDGHPVIINHRFAGQYYDEETGLYYNDFRYYDPKIGRYITSDPIGLAGGLNTYAYVANNPLAFSDPTGECPWCIAYVVFEVGLAIYDAYDTANTIFDPCASTGEKAIAGGLYLLGAIAPGSGYSKLDDIADAAKNGRKFWVNSTKFQGNKVFQRNDLIDPKLLDGRGRTNLERMQKGLAPIGPDGKSMNLHHLTQSHNGSIAEMTQTFHQQNSRVIHINPNTTQSGIDRKAFNKWRTAYWKSRANDFK